MTMVGSKGLRLLASRELTQIVACRARKSEALGSTLTGGNILLLDLCFMLRKRALHDK